MYTAEVTVTDTAGATGTAAAVPVATDGRPTVTGVTVTGNGQAVNVTANVNAEGLATTCQVAVGGSARSKPPAVARPRSTCRCTTPRTR